MNNYSITFKSLRAGTAYTVNIGGGTGSAIPLKGGAQPFVTEEDDTEDFFAPVRTQTGYLRVVDDGFAADGTTAFNWKDMIPATDTSRPVTLTANGSVVWQGFMQAQNFGGTLYGNPQEREFPIQCPLSALSASDVDDINRELKNFAYIIKQAFDNLTGISISRYIFQGGVTAQSWLLKLVDWQNFIQASDDGLSGKYDNLTVLQDLCAFWGWTCRVNNQDVVFACVDDATVTGMLTLTQSQLNSMAGGTVDGTIGQTFLSGITLSGEIFASTDNEDGHVRGVSRAMVTNDGSPAERSVLGFAPDSVQKEMEGRTTRTERDGNKWVDYTEDLLSFTSDYLKGECRSGYASFNIVEIRDIRMGSGETSNIIQLKKYTELFSGTAYASLQTTFHHSFYDSDSQSRFGVNSGFTMKAKVYIKSKQVDDHDPDNEMLGLGTMYMRVGVGIDRQHAMWWNGTSWSDSIDGFAVALGNLDDQLYIKVGNDYYSWIPTNQVNLFGKLFVDFFGVLQIHGQPVDTVVDIHDFNFEFVRSTSVAEESETVITNRFGNFGGARKYRVIERAGSREYTSKNTSKVRDEWYSDVIYASDNDMQNGYGVVLEPNGVQMGKQTYGNNQSWPEQHLADRVTNYWSTSKRKIACELKSNAIGQITPQNTVTLDGTTGYPIAISHEWRDDITKLTIIEL